MKHHVLPRSLRNREDYIVAACCGQRVLHLGCADFPFTRERIASGTWLHQRIADVSAECIGVDLDEVSVQMLAEEYGVENIVCGDAERLGAIDLGLFDVIVAGEIIEHLNNPGMFLESAKTNLKPGGKLILTTANAFCLRRMIRIPFGVESVHQDHVAYYSHPTLHTLVSRYGYAISEAHSYRILNKKPLFPYVVERLSTFLSPNLGEGIIRVYSVSPDS